LRDSYEIITPVWDTRKTKNREVVISRESARQLQLTHYGKGDAVCVGEVLICVLLEDLPGGSLMPFVNPDQAEEFVGNQILEQVRVIRSSEMLDKAHFL
jgi:hypothetical protein